MHLLLTQALLREQSLLFTHSGRHPEYGSPKKVGMHVQDPAPFCSLQTAFAPQGDGEQGCGGAFVGTVTVREVLVIFINSYIQQHCYNISMEPTIKKLFRNTCTIINNSQLWQLTSKEDIVYLTWLRVAHRERVTRKADVTHANGRVIYHWARSRNAARSRTWIATALWHTRQMGWTLGVECALMATIRCTSHELGLARASGKTINLSAHRVWTARRWWTRIYGFIFRF